MSQILLGLLLLMSLLLNQYLVVGILGAIILLGAIAP